jgi:uncharacterized protein
MSSRKERRNRMLTLQYPVELSLEYPLDKEFDLKRIAFFDIETTGFSADMSYLYLIGCIYYEAPSFQLIQWFAEDIHEEANLISSFFEFLKERDVLIHYNGSGFDIPYLQRKCKTFALNYSFDAVTGIDLYKKILPYKKIFKTNNFKQKTIETFLKIKREDIFDGGDLIQVYQSYLGRKRYETLRQKRIEGVIEQSTSEAEILLRQLLLHNEDDLKGLVRITPILSYVDLFEKPIRILQARVEKDILTIHFETSSFLPTRINYSNDIAHLTAYEKTASLSIPVYEGELRHFYDNYKDYYYLPSEDTVVHKSLALFVDKDYREKAKPSNCYTKKQGNFVPQYEPLIAPYFKKSYQDKLTYLEIHTDFLLQEENLENYVTHILTHLITSKS